MDFKEDQVSYDYMFKNEVMVSLSFVFYVDDLIYCGISPLMIEGFK